MASRRCGCASDNCSCVITSGDGVVVSGSGTKTNPYVIEAVPESIDLAVEDEGIIVRTGVTSINFTGGGVTTTSLGAGEVTVNVPASSGGGIGGVAVQVDSFTASGTWTKPANLLYAVVEVQGAGGGGGGVTTTVASQASMGSGGGAGGYARKVFTATALAGTETVVVGVGGSAGPANNSGAIAGTGGLSSFHGVVANGGLGGATASNALALTREGGAGGTATGGDVNVTGGSGRNARVVNGDITSYGPGGDSFFGAGGQSPYLGTGLVGKQGGGGGGSVIGSSTAGVVGSLGGSGLVIVTSYIKI